MANFSFLDNLIPKLLPEAEQLESSVPRMLTPAEKAVDNASPLLPAVRASTQTVEQDAPQVAQALERDVTPSQQAVAHAADDEVSAVGGSGGGDEPPVPPNSTSSAADVPPPGKVSEEVAKQSPAVTAGKIAAAGAIAGGGAYGLSQLTADDPDVKRAIASSANVIKTGAPNEPPSSDDNEDSTDDSADDRDDTPEDLQKTASDAKANLATPKNPDEQSPSTAPKSFDDIIKDPSVLAMLTGKTNASVDALAQAQQQSQNTKDSAFWADLGARFASTLNHQDPNKNPALALTDQMTKQADIPLNNYLQQVSFEAEDPASSSSVGFRQYAQQLGYKLPDNFSAQNGQKLIPYLYKSYAEQQAQKFGMQKETYQQQQENVRSTERAQAMMRDTDVRADANKMYHQQLMQQHSDAQDMKQQMLQQKQDEASEKYYSDISNKANTYRGNTGAQKAAERLGLIQQAQGLISQWPDLSQMPQAQVNNLTSEVAKIAQGGASTEAGMKEAGTNTFVSGFNDLMARTKNSPTGADLAPFIQNQANYLSGLSNVNNKILDQYKDSIFKGAKHKFTPEQVDRWKNETFPDVYNRLENPPADVLGSYRPSSTGSDPGITDYAKQYFGGDYNKAQQYLKHSGQIQ